MSKFWTDNVYSLMERIDKSYKKPINEGAWGVGPRQSDNYLDLQSLL